MFQGAREAKLKTLSRVNNVGPKYQVRAGHLSPETLCQMTFGYR